MFMPQNCFSIYTCIPDHVQVKYSQFFLFQGIPNGIEKEKLFHIYVELLTSSTFYVNKIQIIL